MNPRASAPKTSVGLARSRPVGELADRLGEVLRIGDERHQVLEDDPFGREVRNVADPVAEIEASSGPLHRRAELADDKQVRELLGDARERSRGRRARPCGAADCEREGRARRAARRAPPGVPLRSGTCADGARRCRIARDARTPPRCRPRSRRRAARRPRSATRAARTPRAAVRGRATRKRARRAPPRRSRPRGRARRRSAGASGRSTHRGRRAPRGSRGAAGTRRAAASGSSSGARCRPVRRAGTRRACGAAR